MASIASWISQNLDLWTRNMISPQFRHQSLRCFTTTKVQFSVPRTRYQRKPQYQHRALSRQASCEKSWEPKSLKTIQSSTPRSPFDQKKRGKKEKRKSMHHPNPQHQTPSPHPRSPISPDQNLAIPPQILAKASPSPFKTTSSQKSRAPYPPVKPSTEK